MQKSQKKTKQTNFCLVAHKTCMKKTFMCVKLPNWSQGRNSPGDEYWAEERNETAKLLHWETYVLYLHIYHVQKTFWYIAALLKIIYMVVWSYNISAGFILACQVNYIALQRSL